MTKIIEQFQGEHRFLSNFYPVLLTWNGKNYFTSEHVYQAMKMVNQEDRNHIAAIPDPGEAKRFARKCKLREDWDIIKLGVMRRVCLMKFMSNDVLRQKLLDTGDAVLVEGNTWGDMYWGVCNGKGYNHLGIILMDVRRFIVNFEPG